MTYGQRGRFLPIQKEEEYLKMNTAEPKFKRGQMVFDLSSKRVVMISSIADFVIEGVHHFMYNTNEEKEYKSEHFFIEANNKVVNREEPNQPKAVTILEENKMEQLIKKLRWFYRFGQRLDRMMLVNKEYKDRGIKTMQECQEREIGRFLQKNRGIIKIKSQEILDLLNEGV